MNLKSQMLPSQRVESIIKEHIQRHLPFSLIRINDGENRALGYNIFVAEKQIPRWFRYTGVEKPDEKVRKALLQSIRDADMVGFPTQDNPVFRPLSEKILTYYQLKPKSICNGIINRFLLKNGGLKRIIGGKRVALIGLTIGEAAEMVQNMGARIVLIEKVHGFNDIPRVLNRLSRAPEYDLALVSAGIPAKIICTQISKRFRKVALDMGHLPELLLYPDKRYGEVISDWLNRFSPALERKASIAKASHEQSKSKKKRINPKPIRNPRNFPDLIQAPNQPLKTKTSISRSKLVSPRLKPPHRRAKQIRTGIYNPPK